MDYAGRLSIGSDWRANAAAGPLKAMRHGLPQTVSRSCVPAPAQRELARIARVACKVCGFGGHNSRTCPEEHEPCPNCVRPTADMRNYSERHDRDYCSPITSPDCWGGNAADSAEVSGGTSYCCGMMYEDGEDTCASCGEPL